MTTLSRSASPAMRKGGPIADRARVALRTVAEQFGRVEQMTKTAVSVDTGEGFNLNLHYELGNFLFSRVYNLQITSALPDTVSFSRDLSLSYRGSVSPRFIGKASAVHEEETAKLNDVVRPLLSSIDLASANVDTVGGASKLTLSPLGGSFVWVLIPPIFKVTAFPTGEPARIINLITTIRNIATAHKAGTEEKKGPTI